MNNKKININNNKNITYNRIQEKTNLKIALNIIPKQNIPSSSKNSKTNHINNKMKEANNFIKN